jgi:uncharacterized membrane protein AbrB (regulator of aidB expression)
MVNKLIYAIGVALVVVAVGFSYGYFVDHETPFRAFRGSIAGGVGAMIGFGITEAFRKKE